MKYYKKRSEQLYRENNLQHHLEEQTVSIEEGAIHEKTAHAYELTDKDREENERKFGIR